MSLTVTANEHGQIRVFRLSEALQRALSQSDDMGPLEKALEVIIAKPEDVQIVLGDSLKGVGLAPFLAMGYGVDGAELAAAPGLQDATEDSFVVIRSGAFGGAEVTLNDTPDAVLIATLTEEGATPPSLAPLQSDSAEGSISGAPIKPPKSDAGIGGMIATYVLLFLFALTALMIWIAS